MVYGILLSPFALDFLGNDSNRYLAIFMITMFFLALSMMFISIPVQTMIQRKTPNEYMSRVFSIVGLISKAGVPIGGLVYGLLIDNFPIHLAVTISVFIVALISINFIIKFRKVKEV
jgi:predicted MFS family arabinose efflux permease